MLPDEIQTKEFATQSFSKMVYHNQTFRRGDLSWKNKVHREVQADCALNVKKKLEADNLTYLLITTGDPCLEVAIGLQTFQT